MYELSYVDASFKANILYAIDRYEQLNPGKRLEDIRRCREIANEEYHTNFALIDAMKTYLEAMLTGFRLFGLDSARINTGHSTLKNLVFDAFKTRSHKELLVHEKKVFEQLKRMDGEGSRETLLFDKKKLTLEISMLKHQNEMLESKVREMDVPYRAALADKKSSNKKLLALIEEQERKDLKIVELSKQIHALTQECQKLSEENKEMRAASRPAVRTTGSIQRSEANSTRVQRGAAAVSSESIRMHTFFGESSGDRARSYFP